MMKTASPVKAAKARKEEAAPKKEKEAAKEKPPKPAKAKSEPKKEEKKKAKKETPIEEENEGTPAAQDEEPDKTLSESASEDDAALQALVASDDEKDTSESEPPVQDGPIVLLDLSPEKFLSPAAFKALEVLDPADEAAEAEKEGEEEELRQTHPTVIVPQAQLDYRFDYARQVRDFELCKIQIWTSDLTDEQQEVLDAFSPVVRQDLNPLGIRFYICAKPKRTARFLLALAAGIPIVDARTFELPNVVAKSKSLKYSHLECLLLSPTPKELAEPYGDKQLAALLAENYGNYQLPFVSSYLQQNRLLQPYQYLVVSDFTLKYNVEDADQLETLLNYALFLAQLGPTKVVVALSETLDSLFKEPNVKKVTNSGQFKAGCQRALVGASAVERTTAYLAQLPAETSVGLVSADGRTALPFVPETTTCEVEEVDKELFARSCFLGWWAQPDEE